MSPGVKAQGPCLLPRAVPCPLVDNAETLTERLEQLSVDDESAKKAAKAAHNISPSDFVTLQSLRSSALARKTNTTSKFSRGGDALFADLLNKDKFAPISAKKKNDDKNEEKDRKPVEKKDGEESSENDIENEKDGPKDGELLSRGPVRNFRPSPNGHHPYNHGIQYGAAALSTVHDYSAFSNYGGGYECGSNWTDSPEFTGYMSSSSTPDTVLSDQGYSSSSPVLTSPGQPVYDRYIASDTAELPEQLADFILKFSRQYTETQEACSPGGHRPASADSGVDSPMSARSAPTASPEVPQGGHSGPTTPSFNQSRMSPRKLCDRHAKQKLRSSIPEHELEDAWAWALKCFQYAPEALAFQDDDGDSLLHIVTAHLDLGKIYSLVEHHLKMDYPRNQKPFDLKNKNHETPLFLAVINRSPQVVAYLLEIGADVNVQTLKSDRDTAMHYAASRGMTKITEMLCAERVVNVNAQNARGLTPLLAAVRSHGIIDEVTQMAIDNKQIVVTLLKSGADPTLVDTTNGKSIIHYAVERMDPELLDVMRRNIEEDMMTEIVNRADFNGEKPMNVVQYPNCSEANKMILPLLTCGAEMK